MTTRAIISRCLLAATVVGALTWGAASPASACTPVTQDLFETQFAQRLTDSDLVAMVEVIDESEPFGDGKATYDVAYVETWKGVPRAGTTVTTEFAPCHEGPLRLDVGDRVLLVEPEVSDEYAISAQLDHLRGLVVQNLGEPHPVDNAGEEPAFRLPDLRDVRQVIGATVALSWILTLA